MNDAGAAPRATPRGRLILPRARWIAGGILLLLAVVLAVVLVLVVQQRPRVVDSGLAVPPGVVTGPRPGSTQLVRASWPVILESARRHNPLAIPDETFAAFIEQILAVEQGEAVCGAGTVCLNEIWYPIWSRIQSSSNDERQTNASVGVAQIRPETALQLSRGWIRHGDQVIWHGVRPAYGVLGPDEDVLSADLSRPAVSIDYLAANLAMGAAVARTFGYEPTLEDLARWHNTGLGWWSFGREPIPEAVWLKGTDYVDRVVAIGPRLAEGSQTAEVTRR